MVSRGPVIDPTKLTSEVRVLPPELWDPPVYKLTFNLILETP